MKNSFSLPQKEASSL